MKVFPRDYVGLAAWIITALAAMSVGLTPFGFNLASMVPGILLVPLYYLVGLAGVVSLAFLFMSCTCGKKCRGCGKSSCC